jgi:hypothetical protein
VDSTFPHRKADHETRTTLVHRHRGGHGVGHPGAGPGDPCRCPAGGRPGLAGVSLISDDNFSATQFTRVLNLLVKLP